MHWQAGLTQPLSGSLAGCSLRADHELENWPAAAPGPLAGVLNPRFRPNRPGRPGGNPAAGGPRAGGLNPRFRPNRETPGRFRTESRLGRRRGAEIGIPGATRTGRRGFKVSDRAWESPGVPCFLILAESPGDSRFPPPAAIPAGGNPHWQKTGE